jgi:hypothetical protein
MHTHIIIHSHARQRMFERSISQSEVDFVLQSGQVIELRLTNWPDSVELVLGWVGARPLHIVIDNITKTQTSVVRTVYEPNLVDWFPDFRTRRPKP